MIDQGKQILMFVGLTAFLPFFYSSYQLHPIITSLVDLSPHFAFLVLNFLNHHFSLGYLPIFHHFPSCFHHFPIMYPWFPSFSLVNPSLFRNGRPPAARSRRRGAGLGTLQLCGWSHAALGTQAPECETGERIKQWNNKCICMYVYKYIYIYIY